MPLSSSYAEGSCLDGAAAAARQVQQLEGLHLKAQQRGVLTQQLVQQVIIVVIEGPRDAPLQASQKPASQLVTSLAHDCAGCLLASVFHICLQGA